MRTVWKKNTSVNLDYHVTLDYQGLLLKILTSFLNHVNACFFYFKVLKIYVLKMYQDFAINLTDVLQKFEINKKTPLMANALKGFFLF